MATLKYTTPTVGQKNTVAEPLVDTALTELRTVVNGELEGSGVNIKAGTVDKLSLSAAVQAELAAMVGLPLEAKKSIIATEESRESVSYGVLTTPDEVEVVMPTYGLFAVGYHATVTSSVASAGKVAIFIGANQLKNNSATPLVQEVATSGATANLIVSGVGINSGAGGLERASTGYVGDVTTGQIVPAPVHVFAAAGTYKVSVRFLATSGKVTAKERKLWVWVVA